MLPGQATVSAQTYTVPQIARLAQSSDRHIRRLIDAGKVPGKIQGLGRLVRFSKVVIDAWLAGEWQVAP